MQLQPFIMDSDRELKEFQKNDDAIIRMYHSVFFLKSETAERNIVS